MAEAEMGNKVGIRFCKDCEMNLRCSECVAKGDLDYLRHSNTCNNCKVERCSFRKERDVRVDCIFWSESEFPNPEEISPNMMRSFYGFTPKEDN